MEQMMNETDEQDRSNQNEEFEFSPTGTLFLLSLYFLLLVALWVFMYFVEFLGGGPTIIGG